MEPCRLYLITPSAFELAVFVDQVKSALDGGDVACLQLRMKEAEDSDIVKAGEALLPLCDAHNIPFIINDRPDIAMMLGADGVHIGLEGVKQPETMVRQLRKSLREGMILGASCYDSRDLAMIAGEEGADYVSFGAFYPTKTKQSPGKPSPDLLHWWSNWTVLPCVAIGGITVGNCGPLVEAGADFIAVISAVWEHPKGPGVAVAEINTAIDKAVANSA